MFEGKHSDLTDKIIKAYYKIYAVLGYGFNEKVYEKALVIELRRAGLSAEPQKQLQVYYEGELVGEYFADVVVEQLVIIELKAVRALAEEHEAQLLNYLKATRVEVGLLMNFGPKPDLKRKVYDNELKGSLAWSKLEFSPPPPKV